MADNNERVQQVLDIYRETQIGLGTILDVYDMDTGQGEHLNPYQSTYVRAIQSRASEAIRTALERGESPVVSDAVNEGLGWFSVEVKRKLGSAAYSLFVAKQDEKVEELLTGTHLRATSIKTGGFGAIRRSNGIIESSGGHLPQQVIAPFFKADTNAGHVILREEATDEMLDDIERRHKLWHPDSFKYIYWVVDLFGGLQERTQNATLEIVEVN